MLCCQEKLLASWILKPPEKLDDYVYVLGVCACDCELWIYNIKPDDLAIP